MGTRLILRGASFNGNVPSVPNNPDNDNTGENGGAPSTPPAPVVIDLLAGKTNADWVQGVGQDGATTWRDLNQFRSCRVDENVRPGGRIRIGWTYNINFAMTYLGTDGLYHVWKQESQNILVVPEEAVALFFAEFRNTPADFANVDFESYTAIYID